MLVDEEETKTQIKLFEEQKVRTVWDCEREEWYFSVVDVVGILTESENPRNYWKVLKHRLSEEGSQLGLSKKKRAALIILNLQENSNLLKFKYEQRRKR